jgi:hypothetical protein
MNIRHFISFEVAINALAQLSRRIDSDLSVHAAIDLAGRIVRASEQVNREDIGVVIRQSREFFSVCTKENEGVYVAKDMEVIYPWKPAGELDDKLVATIASLACIGKVKGIYCDLEVAGYSRIEAEHGHVLINRETLEVSEIFRMP